MKIQRPEDLKHPVWGPQVGEDVTAYKLFMIWLKLPAGATWTSAMRVLNGYPHDDASHDGEWILPRSCRNARVRNFWDYRASHYWYDKEKDKDELIATRRMMMAEIQWRLALKLIEVGETQISSPLYKSKTPDGRIVEPANWNFGNGVQSIKLGEQLLEKATSQMELSAVDQPIIFEQGETIDLVKDLMPSGLQGS